MSLKSSCCWWKKTSQPGDRRLKRKTNNCWGKFVDEKPLDLERVLGEKPTPYDWGLKRISESKGRSFDLHLARNHMQSCKVMYNGTGDVKRRS